MPLYIVVNADGTQQRVHNAPLEAGAGQTLLVDERFDAEPSSDEYVWDSAMRAYEEIVQPGSPSYARTKLTKREFLNRVGKQTIAQINARLITPPANAQEVGLVAELMTMKDFLNAVPDVDLENADTIEFVNGLVTLGYKTTAQRDLLLAPATVAAE